MKLNTDKSIDSLNIINDKIINVRSCKICKKSKDLNNFKKSELTYSFSKTCSVCSKEIKLLKKQKQVSNQFIYIIINKSWLDYVKIGRSNNIKNRLNSYQTYCPHKDYELIFCLKIRNIIYVEDYFKSNFKYNGEWFNLDSRKAIEIMNKICIEC